MSAVFIEAVKLLLQFCGALYIAWRTVRWALRRYKDEKHWERKLTAYSELTTALATLLNIVAEWEDQEITSRPPHGFTAEALRDSYWSARQKLEEARSTAMLLLPAKIADLLDDLVTALARNDVDESHRHEVEQLDKEWKLVKDARDAIVAIGKGDLQLSNG
ncbi:hypothetical protein [Mesorhizobium amorphae]|uniref:hypothetical protein n=1 Tax=Mesorhizobium amorphae TaxID=71433 RepID=UPI001182C7A5|nr:hypothetical protein [Mesorhizobium amorphae]